MRHRTGIDLNVILGVFLLIGSRLVCYGLRDRVCRSRVLFQVPDALVPVGHKVTADPLRPVRVNIKDPRLVSGCVPTAYATQLPVHLCID